MKCTTCGQAAPSDAAFCPVDGTPLPGLGAVVATGGRMLSCPGCGTANAPTAKFCKGCGRPLPHSWGAAAQAASDAQPTMPTSSSGRQPGMSPAERDDYLRRVRNREAERAAIAVPGLTGDSLRDLAAAEEHYTSVYALWDQLDVELKQARAEAGLIPTAGDAAELADLQRRTDIAWASRQAAKAHRDALFEAEGRLSDRGLGLPPGTSERSWQPW